MAFKRLWLLEDLETDESEQEMTIETEVAVKDRLKKLFNIFLDVETGKEDSNKSGQQVTHETHKELAAGQLGSRCPTKLTRR